MDQLVARSNIDRYLELLRVEVVPESRSAINSLLIDAFDKLDRTLAHLEYSETRLIQFRQQHERMNGQRERLPPGSSRRATADNVIAGFETTMQILEEFCVGLREDLAKKRP